MTFRRDPIHLGSGEPILLLHPFLCSQEVWSAVAPQLADTGPFRGLRADDGRPLRRPPAGTFLGHPLFADHVERQLDALGWETAHVVGNSLGGWVAFELERRGRARTLTAIAPAGGWTRWSPSKFEMIAKFIAWRTGTDRRPPSRPAILDCRSPAGWRPCPSADPRTAPSQPDLREPRRRRDALQGLCRAAGQVAAAPGLLGTRRHRHTDATGACGTDRVFPTPRGNAHFTRPAAGHKLHRLDGVGHIPMLEAPGRITRLIADFVDEHTATRSEERRACTASRRKLASFEAELCEFASARPIR